MGMPGPIRCVAIWWVDAELQRACDKAQLPAPPTSVLIPWSGEGLRTADRLMMPSTLQDRGPGFCSKCHCPGPLRWRDSVEGQAGDHYALSFREIMSGAEGHSGPSGQHGSPPSQEPGSP